MAKISKDIVENIRNGNEKAFESLFWEYNTRIYHFVYSILYDKSLAEDLTQTVFLKIWEKRQSLDIELSIEAYLFTIARNLVYRETENQLRADLLIEHLKDQSIDSEFQMDELLDAKSLSVYIQSLIDELPPARREIFCLSRFEHLTYKEIASRLSISEKTVETQLSRSLRFLRDKLTSSGLLSLYFLFV